MHPIRSRLAVLAAVVLLAGACSSGSDEPSSTTGDTGSPDTEEPEAITIRVAHNRNAANLALRVADEQGFLAERGITAEFEIVENVGTIAPALGRSFDIGMVPPTALLAAVAEGLDLVWMAGMTESTEDNPVGELITLEGSGIESVADLEGQTLGVLTVQGTLHIATRAWLIDEGIDPNSVNVVQVDGPSHKEQLEANRVDVIETVDPFRGNVMTIEGATSLGSPFLHIAPEGIRPLAYVSTSSWAEENPEVIANLREAIDEAIAFIAENEEEARAILLDYSGLPEPVVNATVLPNYVSDPRVEDLQVWFDTMTKVGVLDADLDLDSLVVEGTR